MKQSAFKSRYGGNKLSDMTFEEYDKTLNRYQKMAYTRWAHKYGYKSYQGYLTARHNFAWEDYRRLRDMSP